MVITATVLYPNEPDLKFDMDYYLATHMPLVQEKWGSMGLTGWKVVQLGPDAEGKPSPFAVQAILEWKDEESIKTATGGDAGKEVFGDIPNFTNVKPTLIAGQLIKTS